MESLYYGMEPYVVPQIYYATIYPRLSAKYKKMHWKRYMKNDEVDIFYLCQIAMEDFQMVFVHFSNIQLTQVLEYLCFLGDYQKLCFLIYFTEFELSQEMEYKILNYLTAHHNKDLIHFASEMLDIRFDQFSEKQKTEIFSSFIHYRNMVGLHMFIDCVIQLSDMYLYILIKKTISCNQYKFFVLLVDLIMNSKGVGILQIFMEKKKEILIHIICHERYRFLDHMLKQWESQIKSILHYLFCTGDIIKYVNSDDMLDYLTHNCKIYLNVDVLHTMLREAVTEEKFFAVKFCREVYELAEKNKNKSEYISEKLSVDYKMIRNARRSGNMEMADYLIKWKAESDAKKITAKRRIR